MLDILTWCWFDPLLEGSRARLRPNAPQIRPDLLMSRRRAKKAGIVYQPPPKPDPNPPRLPRDEAPRAFKPEHVNRLAELFAKHLPVPHRFVCVSDSTEGFSSAVHVIETPPEAREMANWRSPEGNRFPTCYRRLWGQSKEAAKVLSERVLLVDIDLVPVRELTPIVNRPEPFVGWRPYRDWGKKMRIGGGVYLYTPGLHAEVWDRFYADPRGSMIAARNAGFRGSDQAWLSYCLADKVPVYGRDVGIYSIRDLDTRHTLPKDARMVQFNGPTKPWDYKGPATWVASHWGAR